MAGVWEVGPHALGQACSLDELRTSAARGRAEGRWRERIPMRGARARRGRGRTQRGVQCLQTRVVPRWAAAGLAGRQRARREVRRRRATCEWPSFSLACVLLGLAMGPGVEEAPVSAGHSAKGVLLALGFLLSFFAKRGNFKRLASPLRRYKAAGSLPTQLPGARDRATTWAPEGVGGRRRAPAALLAHLGRD